MKKRAFTMVELIFVIVILGILAAVAVPKLNASRADAKTAALKANLVTLAKDLETYYAANGKFCEPGVLHCNEKIPDITSVPFDKGKGVRNRYFQVNGKDCLRFYVSFFSQKFHAWTFEIYNNSDCLDELRKPQYADVQWLFTGYDTLKINNTLTAPRNVVKPPENGGYVSHFMNDPSKGVNFE